MMHQPTYHNITRRAIQFMLCVVAGFAPMHAAWAKHKHHAHKAAKHVEKVEPQSNLELALKAANQKEWVQAHAYARQTGDPVLLKLITWLRLQDPDARASFSEIAVFISNNPGWPQLLRLHLRAEQALRFSNVPDAALAPWFAANPPVSGTGKIKLAELMMRHGGAASDDKVASLIRDAWRTGDFEEPEEQRLLAVYHDVLRPQDHASRVDHLLWTEHPKDVRRMLDLLPDEQKRLMRARLALLENDHDIDFYIAHVPHALLADPGLTYARAQWRASKGDDAGARALLLTAPVTVPYPEKWWKLRDRYIREAIGQRDFSMAQRLLANHGQTDGQEFADAVWLSGWLKLEFLNDPRDAYMDFYRMYDSVKFATSKARAAYWAARAARGAGDSSAEHGWYITAAAWPTTFYGQLAYAQLHEGQPLRVPVEPTLTEEDRQHFAGGELAHAVRLAAKAREMDLATALLHHLVDTAQDAAQIELAGSYGKEIGSPMLSVRGAKRASQHGFVLVKAGYPVLKLPSGLPLEPALALAVVRQESEFDPRAHSKTGALGMMQVLPKTAKEMARKANISYAEERLYEPSYNIELGSTYLSRLVGAYDGSYVMAIAAYNAGPGNVRQWMAYSGASKPNVDAAIDWIETIPFYETRNYVERVLENLQVYRALLTQGEHAPLQIKQDIIRSGR